MARLAFHRLQMRATTVTVRHMRRLADSCNKIMKTAASPFLRVGRQISMEGPWVIALLVCTWLSAVPLLIYPYVKNFVLKDKRTLMEEERVKLCLQKGIDPYPYLTKKEFVYGNNLPGMAREEEFPAMNAWEHRAMVDFQREKQRLLEESNGSMEDTVERLLELREKLREETSKNRRSTTEPSDLVFRGRPDANRLDLSFPGLQVTPMNTPSHLWPLLFGTLSGCSSPPMHPELNRFIPPYSIARVEKIRIIRIRIIKPG
eukprot:gene4394-3195_t